MTYCFTVFFYNLHIIKEAYLASTINLIAVLSSPSITISENAGIHIKFLPLGATKPLAIAIPFIAWFNAPAPIACISTLLFSLNTLASAPATLFASYFDDTFNVYIFFPLFLYT